MDAFNSTTYPIDIEAEEKKFEKDINVIKDIIENLLPDETEEAENGLEEEDGTAGYAPWKQQPADAQKEPPKFGFTLKKQ